MNFKNLRLIFWEKLKEIEFQVKSKVKNLIFLFLDARI